MKLIGKVTDIDIGEKLVEVNNPKKRTAVRTILLNEKGEIAILHKSKKNEYKLIGGGVDEGETLDESLKREVLEETGCEIGIISELGYIEEYRTRDNFTQTSYVYIAQVKKDTHQLHLTEAEAEEGAKLCWYKSNEALAKIAGSYEQLVPSKYADLYNTKFVIKRDEKILNYYILQENEN